MFRVVRQAHKYFGVGLALFLVLISITGFFLATKKQFAWLQPPPAVAAEIGIAAEIVTLETVLESVYALNNRNLTSLKDIDRIDYRPKDNIFKVISNEGYVEVQVDGKTGKVLSTAFRNDQLMEDIHDLSFFADAAHAYLLPIVAIGLLALAVTGIAIFGTPIFRRWQFKKSGGVSKKN